MKWNGRRLGEKNRRVLSDHCEWRKGNVFALPMQVELSELVKREEK